MIFIFPFCTFLDILVHLANQNGEHWKLMQVFSFKQKIIIKHFVLQLCKNILDLWSGSQFGEKMILW